MKKLIDTAQAFLLGLIIGLTVAAGMLALSLALLSTATPCVQENRQ